MSVIVSLKRAIPVPLKRAGRTALTRASRLPDRFQHTAGLWSASIKRALVAGLFRSYRLHHRFLHKVGVLPFSRTFGWERGIPVSRYYLEKFLRDNSQWVRGRCLDFGDTRYRSYFPRATAYEVLDVCENPGVDYVCDIHDVSTLPQAAWDAIICVGVFEHLAYPDRAAASIRQLLKPGGVLLLVVPFLCQVHYVPTDFRRFTPEGLELTLKDAGLTIDSVDFGGNANVVTGSLQGMVVEDFTKAELERKDPVYPYHVLIRARRPT